jgi:L-fuculose-phosphate aldolase
VLAGEGRPSSELAMHLAIYAARPDVRAVVHAHPPVATAFGVAGEPLPDDVLPELICQVGPVAMVPYFTPGTREAHAALAPYLAGHDAFVLANHGATTVGGSLDEAHRRMESLEHAARIVQAARALGRVTPLTAAQRAALPTPRGTAQHPPPPHAPQPGAPPDPGRGADR